MNKLLIKPRVKLYRKNANKFRKEKKMARQSDLSPGTSRRISMTKLAFAISLCRFIFTVVTIYPGSFLFLSRRERPAGCSSEGDKKWAVWEGSALKDERHAKIRHRTAVFPPTQQSYLIYTCMIHIFRRKFHNDLSYNVYVAIYRYR